MVASASCQSFFPAALNNVYKQNNKYPLSLKKLGDKWQPMAKQAKTEEKEGFLRET
jgi:hypothetical protein